MTGGTEDRPRWWAESAAIKADLGLPPYEPPRFEDGVYTHEVIDPLEREHDCTIRFAVVNPRYPDDWMVWIDGDPAFSVGRHRDVDGNTVYEMSATAFRERVLERFAPE